LKRSKAPVERICVLVNVYTLLSLRLFNGKRKRCGCDEGTIIQSVKEFIEQNYVKQMKINFNLIQLDAFYCHGRPFDCNSDDGL
jgi:hypothetical protein